MVDLRNFRSLNFVVKARIFCEKCILCTKNRVEIKENKDGLTIDFQSEF